MAADQTNGQGGDVETGTSGCVVSRCRCCWWGSACTQFDPAVVEAFSEMAAELVWPPDRPAVADQLDPSTTAADHLPAAQRRAC
jgi:hypothetical protein